jgi:hypothetical protein
VPRGDGWGVESERDLKQVNRTLFLVSAPCPTPVTVRAWGYGNGLSVRVPPTTKPAEAGSRGVMLLGWLGHFVELVQRLAGSDSDVIHVTGLGQTLEKHTECGFCVHWASFLDRN